MKLAGHHWSLLTTDLLDNHAAVAALALLVSIPSDTTPALLLVPNTLLGILQFIAKDLLHLLYIHRVAQGNLVTRFAQKQSNIFMLSQQGLLVRLRFLDIRQQFEVIMPDPGGSQAIPFLDNNGCVIFHYLSSPIEPCLFGPVRSGSDLDFVRRVHDEDRDPG